MSERSLASDAANTLERAGREVERVIAEGQEGSVPVEVVQRLLAMATKLYVARRTAGDNISAFPSDMVTATEVVITTKAMLEAVNLELFDLELWNTFGRA